MTLRDSEVVVYIIGPLPLEKIKYSKNSFYIFVDGGLKHRSKFSKSINMISIGDNDSSKSKLDLVYSRNKNESDLALALNLIKSKSVIHLNGFFQIKNAELRMDHMLANIGECFHWVKKHKEIVYLTSRMFIVPAGTNTLKTRKTFSLLTLLKNRILISGQVKYKIQKPKTIQPLSSLGISNKGLGRFTIENKCPLLVILN